MARIRSLKPEFLADEKLAPLDVTSRFVFVGLICMADDCGRLLDNIRLIDATIFPETDDTAREALARLSRIGRIIRGKTASGQKVIQIQNWAKHQRVDHPNMRAALPQIVGSNEDAPIREDVANDSRGAREEFPRDSRLDLRPTTNDQGPGSAEGASPPPAAVAAPPSPGDEPKPKRKKLADPDVEALDYPPTLDRPECRKSLAEWVVHRRLLKEPTNELQLEKTLSRFAPLGPERLVAAIDHTISNGWQGLREPDYNGRAPPPLKPAAEDPKLRAYLDDAAARDARIAAEREARKQAAN